MRKSDSQEKKMQEKQSQRAADTNGYGDKKLNGPNRPST